MLSFAFGCRVPQRWFPLSGWSDDGGSVFRSTWPLTRCWVAGLGRAGGTCSSSVDFSIQTEPSIIRVWQLWPWTPALSAQRVHVKTSPALEGVAPAFITFVFLQNAPFSSQLLFFFPSKEKHNFFCFVLFCFEPLKHLELFCAIICNHTLSTLPWSHSHAI